ncbi:MAG: two-component regulator propeller domain-containing protein, partial [Candidatus Aerophobetes bacterium]
MLLVVGSAVAASSQTPEWIVYDTENSGLPDNFLTDALTIDAQGNIWIGTRSRGLAKFDGGNWTVYDTDNSGLPHDRVVDLAIDAQEDIWIGTSGGLAKFDGENWTVYDTSNSGLPHDHVSALAIDAQENIWIGTRLRGLAVYREGG